MVFSSSFFIFIFLPVFLILFLTTGNKYRDYILLSSGIGFYFWGEPTFSLIAVTSAIFDFVLCQKIYTLQNKAVAKKYLIIGIIANIALLFYFKYLNFFAESFIQLFQKDKGHFELFHIILPIGVSFIVFEKITYLVDVYRGVGKPASSLLKYLNYVFLFPKLLAGPIVKYHEIEAQLNNYTFNRQEVLEGLKRFFYGLMKKVFIADTCGEIADKVFALSGHDLGFSYAWLGIICFTIQIYFDFSGYSDMALGLTRMMGFRLNENFNMPYIAANITEFWRRWHISLSTWIREYLYYPLGGNRVGQVRAYMNLWLCFVLSGLWHGANWTFVLWGVYNGLFLVVDKVFWLKMSQKLPRIFCVMSTLLIVILGWVIFRSSSVEQLSSYVVTLLSPWKENQAYIDITFNVVFAIAVGSILSLAALFPGYRLLSTTFSQWTLRVPVENFLYSTASLFALGKVISVTFNPFLYFRF
jgi:alginate O-acetyltransferase complex protein AlgI